MSIAGSSSGDAWKTSRSSSCKTSPMGFAQAIREVEAPRQPAVKQIAPPARRGDGDFDRQRRDARRVRRRIAAHAVQAEEQGDQVPRMGAGCHSV